MWPGLWPYIVSSLHLVSLPLSTSTTTLLLAQPLHSGFQPDRVGTYRVERVVELDNTIDLKITGNAINIIIAVGLYLRR
ncbi:hypothetical protein BGX38DRAFT_477155 [Terfezia claveryi]|nr:hypothetical protein BGX38DRAFT_477155 [Terfezia claveryi]